MEKLVNKFLKQRYHLGGQVLLALSGGPDSLVLLNILLEFQKSNEFQFGVAHVDHGWRPESAREAEALQLYCQTLGLTFHLKTLDPGEMKGNLEAACREERLKFFQELCQLHHYQAVLLGHHADDHTETILKRILEGTTLPHLRGLQEETIVNELRIWRPLLQVSKKEIEEYVNQHRLNPIIDSTNFDAQYLRTRLRRMIPEISAQFGKDIRATLSRIGEEAKELHEYLSERLKHIVINSGPLGSYMDISEENLHAFEIRFLLRKLCERENIFLSHSLISQACQHLLDKKADCQVLMGNKKMQIDRGRIFVLKDVVMPDKQPLSHQFGPWKIKINEGEVSKGWQSVWAGTIHFDLPPGDYEIGLPDNTINKKWSNAKIPAFLKYLIPVIWKDNSPISTMVHITPTKKISTN